MKRTTHFTQIQREPVCVLILVVPFILCLSSKKGEEGLVSVVADLRQADVKVVKFITETLLTLEVLNLP